MQNEVKWCAPVEGVYKVNTDASMFQDKRIGMGGVTRDFKGDVVKAMCGTMEDVDSVDIAEALSARQGLNIAMESGFLNLVLEVDSWKVFVHLKEGRHESSPFGMIIQDIRNFAAKCSTIAYTHVKRVSNKVAHKLAKHCQAIDCMRIWLEEMPSVIVSAVLADKFSD